ncbi:MAG: hypothetical protein KF805_15555 [Phycisphaeraceae bacterium]|nr:hypothetical protein [Phycisphaeraceae bacterium]
MRKPMLAVALALLVGSSARADGPSLIDIATSILSEAVHSVVPGVIAPLVTAAEDADTQAIAGLEIWLAQRERQLLLQAASTPPGPAYNALLRQIKAVQAMKSKMAGIKNRRTAEEKKKKEDGMDPFYARYMATAPIALPGSNSFSLLVDGAEDIPGDAPPGPMVALVTPPFAGITEPFIPVITSSATAMFTPAAGPPGTFGVAITSFAQTIGSFDVGPGMPTGMNTASLNEFGSAATGSLTPTGIVDMYWEGKYTNAIHSGRAPILFFAASHGALKPTGEAVMIADDPMIVPMPPGTAPEGAPWLQGAAVYSFDSATMTLRVNENTMVVPAGPPVHPDLAMMRDCEGRYTYRPFEDMAIGAKISIPPIPYTGMSGSLFTFGDVPFAVSNGLFTLLEGMIRDIKLDPDGLYLEGTLDITPVAYPVFSRSCNQIMNAPGPRRIIFATAGPAVDLVDATAGFTTSATLPFPEIFSLEAAGSVACPADLNGDSLVDDSDFVIFVSNYNELTVPPASPWADLNGDDLVDDADFVIFVAAYNELLCDSPPAE